MFLEITPELKVRLAHFNATSGNYTTRAEKLGEGGLNITWKHPPSSQVQRELSDYLQTLIPQAKIADVGCLGGRSESMERAKAEFENWRQMMQRVKPGESQ